MTTEWVKNLEFDYIDTSNMMVAEGNTFRHKQSGEYKTAHLRTPYNMVV